MSSDWNLQSTPVPPAPDIASTVGAYVAQVLAARGLNSLESIRAFVTPVLHPAVWPGLDEIVQRLQQAVREQKTVLLWSERTAGSMVAVAMLQTALQKLGSATRLYFDAPISWGVLPERPLLVALGSDPELMSQSAEIDRVVLDHYAEPGWSSGVPVLNPLVLPVEHPWYTLGRVGTTYMLVAALYQSLGLDAEQFLDLAAIGVVAEAAPLSGVHRALVHQGLTRLAVSTRPGLQQLCLTHRDQLFRLAMKLDALAYFPEPSVAVQLLTSEDPETATELLLAMERADAARLVLSEQTIDQAGFQVESFNLDSAGALVLYHPDWSKAALPLTAARLVERYGCPVALLADDPSTSLLWGFARASGRVNLLEILHSVKSLLKAYGGQPTAVWWQCQSEQLPTLRRTLLREFATGLTAKPASRPVPVVLDAETMLDIGQELDRVFLELERLAPFGPGHPRPLVLLRHCRPGLTLSRDGKHLDCKIANRTLRLRGGAEHRHEWQNLDALDITFEMEPWGSNPRVPWWGKVHEIRPTRAVFSPRVAIEPELMVEDCRLRPERAREYVGALVLKDWPLLARDLALQLRQQHPVLIVLAVRPFTWPPLDQAVSKLLMAWETGGNPSACGLPTTLITRLSEGTHRSAAAVTALVREVQAFQCWLDGASVEAIRQLCVRLHDG